MSVIYHPPKSGRLNLPAKLAFVESKHAKERLLNPRPRTLREMSDAEVKAIEQRYGSPVKLPT